jgi:SAM-dependent methyltransferase
VAEPQDTVTAGAAADLVPAYRLAARGREEAEDERLGLLEQIFDPVSRRRRDLVQPGWRCLEVGAGRGSMAVWLAERVGASGHVVATDVDVTYLERLDLPNLEVRQHNILDEPLDVLDPGSFDLVCSRALLFWLAGRAEDALRRMMECLRPGGWLVDEDGDWGTPGPVDPSHPLYSGYHRAFGDGQWWVARGYDPLFGRRLPALFERCGFENIRHEARAEIVRGGSPWARWWRESLDVIRASGLAAGSLTEAPEREHAELTAPCGDPSAWIMSGLWHACWGQRPG